MKAPVLLTVLISLTSLYIFTIEALPQWRPQGRFGKRLDPVLGLLSQLDSSEDDKVEKGIYESKDLLDNEMKVATRWCVQLITGRIRCIGGRNRRSIRENNPEDLSQTKM